MSSFNTIIDTSSVQLGQVTRINITDQGIFRVFYNDISGNMYCALSRESNYNQVIYQSNDNRTIMNNSGMNAPFYGGTYHENELKYMDNSSNFYIYRYPTMGEEMDLCACDRGPISYFTEIQLQKYIKQGDSSGETYNTYGVAPYITQTAYLRAGGNVLAYDYNWYEQVAFGYCTSEKGGYALDPSQAAIIARENGLGLGGNGENFSGSSTYGGLYAFPPDHATYPNMAFYGTSLTDNASRKRATPSPVYRPGVSASTTMAMYVPDVIYLPYNAETFETRGLKLKNKPLNDASFFQSAALGGANNRYITEPWETDVSNNPASGPSSLNVKYYIASKRPQYTWLDSNNYPINPWPNNWQIEETDKYYKGRWAIYVDVKNTVRNPSAPDSFIGNDTSGNIYISRSNRAHKPVYTYCLENHFKNGVTGEPDLSMNDISNVYVDLDLDISTNAINPNFNNIYARPYFIVGSDASTNYIIGRAAFDLSGSDVNTLITPTEDSISLEKYYFDLTNALNGNTGVGLKYCKIKVNSNGNQYWDSAPYTRWHAVYQVKHKSIQAQDCLHYHSGKFEPTGLMFDVSYNLTFKQCQGLFPSMDLDLSANSAGGGIPYVAYFSGKDCPSALDRSIYLIHGNPNSSNDPLEETDWVAPILIEKDVVPSWTLGVGTGPYQDLSNNQPISLKISPYDRSVHICYQKYNGTEYELKYWTNSTNLRDISGVDSSLNYVGLHTQGRTLDISESYVEAYWDLSSAKCIFSRDYTRYDETNKKTTGWIPSVTDNQWQIRRYTKPFGGRDGHFSNPLVYDNPILYESEYFDKIYMITRVKTPSTWGTYEDLFCLGSYPSASNGAYFAGAYYGSPFFGVQSNYQSSNIIATTTTGPPGFGAHCYKNGASTPITSDFVLATDRNYELEYYYNKTNYYAFIKVTDLSGQTAPTTDTYEFYNIDVSGGFNMNSGYLSIGSGAHSNSYTEFWTGEIYKMSIYGTDIDNVPQFTLTRNGEILDTSGNKYSSFFDNSGNKGLDIEPTINNYQVIDVSNSLNGITCPADTSGNSYVKSALLHDIYYYQLIPNQTGIATGGQKVVAFDRFEDGTGIWACGYKIISGNNVPTVWVSFDDGIIWNTKDTPSSIHSQNYGEYFMLIKTHIDISGGKWVFVGGENSLLYASNTYGANGEIDGKTLGNEWKIIGDTPCTNGTGDPSGRYFDKTSNPTNPPSGTSYQSYVSLCPVDINLAESKEIFGGQDASSNAFHLWIGCWMAGTSSTVPGLNKDILLRGNYVDYSNNTLDYSYNIITKAIENTNTFNTSSDTWMRESIMSISFGGADKGVGTGTIEEKILDNSGGLSYGIAGTDNYIYSTKNGGKTWDKKLATQRVETISNSYPNRFVRGTTGTYVEKNKIYDENATPSATFVYDNSGMYVQTQAEPWISLPGFMVADNINDNGFGNYDLSFSPVNNTNPKTITWDPSLNSNDYWNPLVLDNSGMGCNWKVAGGNNYKVYIDNNTSNFGSNHGNKKYKEETFTWDTYNDDGYGSSWGLSNQGSILYQKSSEVTQQWKKLEFSPFDISINELITNQKFNWETMSPVDLSYSIIHNDVYSSVLSDTYGFFKLSRTPPVANFDVDYTSPQTSVTCLLKYKEDFWVSIDRLNLEKLDIETKWYLRKVTTPESSWTRFGDSILKNYNPIFSGLQRGYSYEFYVVLSNKYGEGWSSAISDPINIPSPDPAISDVTRTIKLFENKIQWKPYIETDSVTGTLVKSVYAYDITKQYWDNSQNSIGEWIKDEEFSNAYTDISGQIIQTQWNGVNGDISTNIYSVGLVTDVTLIDTDISLNNVYKYGITPKGSGLFTPASPSYVTTIIDNGKPDNIKYEYFSNDASFNICWNKYQDISSNTKVIWDISWQEIRKEAPPGGTVTDNSGIHVYNDPSGAPSYGTGKNYTRISGLPLTDYHLLADASYNFQIKGRYQNMSNNAQFDTSYNLLYDTNGYQTLPYTYWNQQQIPVLNDIIYNTSTDIIDISWNATTIPDTPYYYDISLSNVTDNRSDYSYNIIVTNGNKLPNISNNGVIYYPGEYNVRVKAAYGNSVPVDTSLFSEWSNSKSFSVPTHLPTNFKVTAYNSNNIEDITDVSYVKLTWDPPGKAISNNIEDYPQLESYSLIRKTANKGYNYIIDYSNNNIDKTLDSFVDNNYPLGRTNTVPRIYRYDLSANYL